MLVHLSRIWFSCQSLHCVGWEWMGLDVQWLMSTLTSVEFVTHSCITQYTQFGWTALHCAVAHEHEDIVEQLLEANADPNLPLKVRFTHTMAVKLWTI